MPRTAVLNVVGLTPAMLGPTMPRLSAWAHKGRMATVRAVTPAVTCAAQATYLTGTLPSHHGIVANGWYAREDAEIRFWKQSNRLIQAPKLWDVARTHDDAFTCANLFWWFNMYASVDFALTPRPMYPADGRKLPDLHSHPPTLRHEAQARLGMFPLFNYWGPTADIRSSQWIAAAAKWVEERHHPTLSLVYLPHLDYGLQKLGPNHPGMNNELAAIDAVAGELIDHLEANGVQVVVLSEYGITPVTRPVRINRMLRERGLITVRDELGLELLDAGASAAFAVCDHQIAHIYVNDRAKLSTVRHALEGMRGIERVLEGEDKRAIGLDHPRAGDMVAVAEPDAWFSYYYWMDDRKAPDFARTVDIHRKPGYDPVELFVDPSLRFPQWRIAKHLIKKSLGFRSLLQVIPLDDTLVRGSHGRPPGDPQAGPLVITRRADLLTTRVLDATDVFSLLLSHLGVDRRHLAEST